jgi:oxygen-dependent protoporphyrinogen oxidase
MPSSLSDIFSTQWSEPVFANLVLFLLRGMFSGTPQVPRPATDESIGEFLNRCFGSPAVTDNIASAVLHGIYAGDIYKLSARSLMPKLWMFDHNGGIFKNVLVNRFIRPAKLSQDYAFENAMQVLAKRKEQGELPSTWPSINGSAFSFTGGIEALPKFIECSLRDNPEISKGVKIELNAKVDTVAVDSRHNGLKVC